MARARLSHRGTSNTNVRGSSHDRRRRKRWLLETFDVDLGPDRARCAHCETIVTYETMEVDRIVPGALGGRYIRSNIWPSCQSCNMSAGHALQQELHAARCKGDCRRCRLVADYRAAREAAELQRERETCGYATETALYGPIVTFKDFLTQTVVLEQSQEGTS